MAVVQGLTKVSRSLASLPYVNTRLASTVATATSSPNEAARKDGIFTEDHFQLRESLRKV